MNVERLLSYNPVLLALAAMIFTWSVTAAGASLVFFFKSINKKVLNSMLGFTTMMLLDVALS